jgi:hypothetical protein
MTGRVTATAIVRLAPGDAGSPARYSWNVGTIAEGRRNLRGLERQGHAAELVRADGKIERNALAAA